MGRKRSDLAEEFRPGFEFYGGNMGGGKTNELIRFLQRANFVELGVQAFKKLGDKRYEKDFIYSNGGDLKYPATAVSSTEEMVSKIRPDTQIIGFDELQFWDENIISFIKNRMRDVRIVASGVIMDYRKESFPFRSLENFAKDSEKKVTDVLHLAQKVNLFWPVCTYRDHSGKICGNVADYVQRWNPEGNPSSYDEPTLGIGKVVSNEEERIKTCNEGMYSYAVRCVDHYLGFE